MNDTVSKRMSDLVSCSVLSGQPAIRVMFVLVMIYISILAVSRAQGAATFTGLGDLPGGFVRSAAFGISGNGLVVVGSSPSSLTFNTDEAYRWTSAGGLVGLGASGPPNPPPSPTSRAFGASSDGAVVVGEDGPGARKAFRWTSATGRVSLGVLPGQTSSNFSFAWSTSADGSVVVGTSETEAFRWTSAEGMVGLGGPPGGFFSHAWDVSADGMVIAGSIETGAPFSHDAFRWTAATGLVHLGGGDAYGISADGNVIVGTDGSQAFRWTAQSGIVRIGDLPGGRVIGIAYDLSADGSVIVGSGETAFDGNIATNQAFYWTANTGMLNLRDFLVTHGATGLDGWTLTEARGVSWDGQTIVGTGIHDGVTEAFVATIPEPSTLLLAALAVLVLFVVYLRKTLASRATAR
jgi:uncharacterized membrane protein